MTKLESQVDERDVVFVAFFFANCLSFLVSRISTPNLSA